MFSKPANDQCVHRHPDRPAPVGVSAEHSGIRFAGQVLHLDIPVPQDEDERVLEMIFRERANAIRAEKLVFVEHVAENAPQLFLVADR